MTSTMDFISLCPFSPLTLTVVVIFLATYLSLLYLSKQKWHPSEPPIVPSPIPIPYIGHLLGMVLLGGYYIKRLGITNQDKPIFTLAVPFSRLYIVTSPSLAAVIQRKPTRQLSFSALLPELTQRVMGLDNATRAIVSHQLDPERNEERGFVADMHDMVYSYLGPGRELESLMVGAARELAAELDSYYVRGTGEDGRVEILLPWIRHLVTNGTSRVLYGDKNPLNTIDTTRNTDEQGRGDLEAAFWDFDHGLGRLLLGFFPSATARKAYYGREKLAGAFRRYLENRNYEKSDGGDGGRGASDIVLRRIRIAAEHGLSPDGTARSELSFLFAGIVNTATTTFWMVLRIFADRYLLETIREELTNDNGGGAIVSSTMTTTTTTHIGQVSRKLSLSRLTKDNHAACPTLYAVYKEVLRLGSNNFGTRLVQADTTLTATGHHRDDYDDDGGGGDGNYFLRQGGMVQIAGGVMHADRSTWGDDANVFNPDRHLERNINNKTTITTAETAATTKTTKKKNSVHPAAFRAFGGGKTMCPGRHFATGQILSLVACIVLRFEMEGVDEADGIGEIQVPNVDEYILPVHILEPVAGDPVRVRIRSRVGDDGGSIDVVP